MTENMNPENLRKESRTLDNCLGAILGIGGIIPIGAATLGFTPTPIRWAYELIRGKGEAVEHFEKNSTTQLPKYGIVLGAGLGLWALTERAMTGHSSTYDFLMNNGNNLDAVKCLFYTSLGFEIGRFVYRKNNKTKVK